MEEDVLTKHIEEYTRVWKRKQEQPTKEECGISLYAQNKENLLVPKVVLEC
jgi:hypothetical protein